jgi:hypothetical protein
MREIAWALEASKFVAIQIGPSTRRIDENGNVGAKRSGDLVIIFSSTHVSLT